MLRNNNCFSYAVRLAVYFLCLFVGASLAYASSDESIAKNEKAVGLVANGDIAAAKVLFNEVISLSPGFYTAKNMLSLIEKKESGEVSSELFDLIAQGSYKVSIKDYDSGIVLLKEASAVSPETSFIYGKLGEAYVRNRMDDEAIKALDRAIELDPSSDSLYYLLGSAYLSKNNFEEAIIHIEKAIKIDPLDDSSHLLLGFAYSGLGYPELAEMEFESATRIKPTNSLAQYYLARSFYNSGRFEDAVEHCDKALSLGYEVPPDFIEQLKPYRTKQE